MVRSFALALAALTLSFSGGFTDDKKDEKDKKDKPAFAGTWTRESNGLDLKFEFIGKDMLKMSAMVEDNGVIVTTKYTVKDGVITAKVTDVEVKGEFKNKPPKDLEVKFKWKVKGDTATLDDFEAENLEQAKEVLEGEYAKKKEKK
jgi:hypothetical protein